jgi:small conductance mechanosensitive channel
VLVNGSSEPRRMFETHSHAWREVGLARQLSRRAVKRARIQAAVFVPLLVGILVVYAYRDELFGSAYDRPVRILTAIALCVVGWQVARDVGRALGPTLFRRLDPGTAGTVGFLIRLGFLGVAFLVALRVAGLDPRTLVVGGAFTAVILGLAAQQTLGNLFAGVVLLSARPFRVGERVRLQGGGLAGQLEGVVSSLGLLYTTFAQGDDQIMVPNSVVLNVAIVPLREPDGVDLRARLSAGVTPLEIQQLLEEAITTPVRDRPQIRLEEVDGDEVVVRITATPEHPVDGPKLASEVLEAIASHDRAASGSL